MLDNKPWIGPHFCGFELFFFGNIRGVVRIRFSEEKEYSIDNFLFAVQLPHFSLYIQ